MAGLEVCGFVAPDEMRADETHVSHEAVGYELESRAAEEDAKGS